MEPRGLDGVTATIPAMHNNLEQGSRLSLANDIKGLGTVKTKAQAILTRFELEG